MEVGRVGVGPKLELKLRLLKYFFGQVGGWEDELKNKTNISQSWS